MGYDWNGEIKEAFNLPDADPSGYAPLTLAYIGDAVYELIIRTITAGGGSRHLDVMNKEKAALVEAGAQAEVIKVLMDDLTDEEYTIYKRGRNARSVSVPKNSKMSDYRMATGFEALIGWLYLTGQYERLTELVREGLKKRKEAKDTGEL